MGVMFSSQLLGSLIQIIENVDRNTEIIEDKLKILDEFNKKHNLSMTLVHRIQKHIENSSLQNNFQDSEKFMSELPLKLREALVHKTHGGVIEQVKFF